MLFFILVHLFVYYCLLNLALVLPSGFLQGILSDVLKCLGDNKKHMRESTLTTLDSWLAAVHLDKMVSAFFSLFFCCTFMVSLPNLVGLRAVIVIISYFCDY